MNAMTTPDHPRGSIPTGNEFLFPSLDFPALSSPTLAEIAARLRLTVQEVEALVEAGQLKAPGEGAGRCVADDCYRQLIHRRATGYFVQHGFMEYQLRALFRQLSPLIGFEPTGIAGAARNVPPFFFPCLDFPGRTTLLLEEITLKLDCFDVNYLRELIEDGNLVALELSPRRHSVPIYRVPIEAYRTFVVGCWTSPIALEFRNRLKAEMAAVCHREIGEYLGATWRERLP